MASDKKQLEVRVWDKPVGILEQTDPPKHVFTYLPSTPTTHFVSLTMPVRAESYVWERGLHPSFQINLPEGYRKDLLREKFGPVATVDDFSLLALTGSSTLGRVTVHAPRQAGLGTAPHTPVADILAHKDSRLALLHYLEEAPLDAISGVMPKALAEDERLTLRTPDWILKTGREDTPGIAVNEYVCLNLARKIGLPVPEAKLSNDGEVLAVARFDLSPTGTPQGLEDFCALLGMAPSQKYDATAEQIARAMMAFVAGTEKLDCSKRLLDMLILNAAIRNADAHSKNYALLYSSREDVTLAPVYDVLSVQAYDAYRLNPYPILIGGTKGWDLRKPLERFAAERLTLSPSRVGHTIQRIATAMNSMAGDLGRLADRYPAFRETARAMTRIWTEGMAGLAGESKSEKLDFSAAKLSDERPRKRVRSARNSEPLK
ncbi:MAG: type II toxin-antitoxin system HipA family toxin [Betaproteobacteria bacterium]